MDDYGKKGGQKKGSGSMLQKGLTKCEGFTPHASSPAETSTNHRPKHDNDMIKRTMRKG